MTRPLGQQNTLKSLFSGPNRGITTARCHSMQLPPARCHLTAAASCMLPPHCSCPLHAATQLQLRSPLHAAISLQLPPARCHLIAAAAAPKGDNGLEGRDTGECTGWQALVKEPYIKLLVNKPRNLIFLCKKWIHPLTRFLEVPYEGGSSEILS